MLPYPDYLAHLDADAHLLAAAASMGLSPLVPGCPGWTVADLVDHVTRVHASRTDIVEQGLVDRWPPARQLPEGLDPIAWYREGASRLSQALAAADPAAPAKTFSREQTVGFWIRRMAHETLVHRIDAEQAHGCESQVDPELAADGVAEIVEVFITRFPDDWGEFLPGDTVVRIDTADQSWMLRLGRFVGTKREEVIDMPKAVVDQNADPAATISGDPGRVLLWMWGRAPLDDITVVGDAAAAHRLREVCSI
jgi:uncharacterized protein (TIGR03083 family)